MGSSTGISEVFRSIAIVLKLPPPTPPRTSVRGATRVFGARAKGGARGRTLRKRSRRGNHTRTASFVALSQRTSPASIPSFPSVRAVTQRSTGLCATDVRVSGGGFPYGKRPMCLELTLDSAGYENQQGHECVMDRDTPPLSPTRSSSDEGNESPPATPVSTSAAQVLIKLKQHVPPTSAQAVALFDFAIKANEGRHLKRRGDRASSCPL